MITSVLITGGAGFIGSSFIRKFYKEYNIIVVDKLTYAGDLYRIKNQMDKITFIKGDITNQDLMYNIFSRFKPKIIIHFAAESHVDNSIKNPDIFIKTNIVGTNNLLHLSTLFDVEKFINISTDEVYGDLTDNTSQFFEDKSPLNPSSPYSASKASSDMLGRAYYRTYNLPVITVRPSNNYGPYQHPEKLIPYSIKRILTNKKPVIYGTGENIREWLYVDDCVNGINLILQKGKPGEVYNIGSNIEKRNIDVVKQILSLLNKPQDYIEFIDDRPGHDYRYSVNTDKIKSLGFKIENDFDTQLEKTVKWYVDNKEQLLSK